MGQLLKSTLLVLTALFPIVNPLGGAPIFLSLTRYYSTEQRRLLSWRIALNCVVLIVASYFIGTYILDFFGISIPVVQVGGGMVVVSTGWALLKQKDDDDTKEGVHRSIDTNDLFQRAFYPLTLPLTVGPGSISVAITLGANEPHSADRLLMAMIGALLGSLLVGASVYLCYAFSDRLALALGNTGMSVVMRLSSFLLVCIGTQIVWNGLSAMLKSLPEFRHAS